MAQTQNIFFGFKESSMTGKHGMCLLKRKQVHQQDGILCGQERIQSIFNDMEKCSWYVKWKKQDIRLEAAGLQLRVF